MTHVQSVHAVEAFLTQSRHVSCGRPLRLCAQTSVYFIHHICTVSVIELAACGPVPFVVSVVLIE